jgi:hypothetical protein
VHFVPLWLNVFAPRLFRLADGGQSPLRPGRTNVTAERPEFLKLDRVELVAFQDLACLIIHGVIKKVGSQENRNVFLSSLLPGFRHFDLANGNTPPFDCQARAGCRRDSDSSIRPGYEKRGPEQFL